MVFTLPDSDHVLIAIDSRLQQPPGEVWSGSAQKGVHGNKVGTLCIDGVVTIWKDGTTETKQCDVLPLLLTDDSCLQVTVFILK